MDFKFVLGVQVTLFKMADEISPGSKFKDGRLISTDSTLPVALFKSFCMHQTKNR